MSDEFDSRRNENEVVRRLLTERESLAPGSREHAGRVAVYACAAYRLLAGEESRLRAVRYAAELHVLGMESEGAGPSLRSLSGEAFLRESIAYIEHLDDWWNGVGRPEGKAGWQIPIASRVIAIADVFDEWTLPISPHSQALSECAALSAIRELGGRRFDPAAVLAFERVQKLIQPHGL